MSRIGLAAAALALSAVWVGAAHAAPGPDRGPPAATVSVTRMFTGPDGATHTEMFKVPAGEFQKVAGIQFNRVTTRDPKTPAAFGWHNAPHRRYVVTLSGRARIEMSGEKKLFIADKDHVLLAADTTGKGHRYVDHPLGKEDWVTIFIEVDQPATPARR